MKNSVFYFGFFLLVVLCAPSFAQVGINIDEPNQRAVLDLHSPTNDQGLLVPRLTTSQRIATAFTSSLTESENGLLIFDTDTKLFYYWISPSWKAVEAGSDNTTWRSGSNAPDTSIGADGDFFLNILTGDVFKKNSGTYEWTLNIEGGIGAAGPTGSTGPVGPQGLVGPAGVIGPQGVQGIKGDKGDTGLQGIQGAKGDTGATGMQGIQGGKGDTGDTGDTGLQGIQGLKGDMGVIGPQGIQGLKGDTGDTGAAGPQGIQGIQGIKGDTGATGPQGPIGLTGPEGPQGIPGVSTAFTARSVSSNYTATSSDDVIIVLNGSTTITLPSAGSVPGKMYHIRHHLGLLDLGSVTIRAPAGNSIIDGSAAQTFTIGLLNPTAITVIAVDTDKWYVIGKF